MSISLNTQAPVQQQPLPKQLAQKKFKTQIIEIGKIDPEKSSLLSKKVVFWDGSQKSLDELKSEDLEVSHLISPKLLGGMMYGEKEDSREKQHAAFRKMEKCFSSLEYDEAAKILCKLEEVDLFPELKQHLENNGKDKYLEGLKEALITISVENKKADKILREFFNFYSDVSNTRMAVPNKLIPVCKAAEELAVSLRLLEISYGKKIFRFKNPPQFNFSPKARETSFTAKVSPFSKNQLIWTASLEVTGKEIKYVIDFIKRLNHSAHINTGSHGNRQGLTIWDMRRHDKKTQQGFAESAFLMEDVITSLNEPNVSLTTISTYQGPIYPEEANHVINAWCFSEKRSFDKDLELLTTKIENFSFQQGPPAPHVVAHSSSGIVSGLLDFFFSSSSSPATPYSTPSPAPIDSPHIQAAPQTSISAMAFGKTKWAKYFGDIGTEPPLPPNIEQILNSECIFWPGKKVRDTHLLVLVPNKVNGKPFHLNSLKELIQSPKTGNKADYIYYNDDVKNELGTKSEGSHWVLMTRDVIPDSRSKKYEDQKALVASHASRSGIPYVLPKALDATTAILIEYVQTGKRLYSKDPLTYTRCQEKVDKNQWPAAIGAFDAGGLWVTDHFIFDTPNYGVAGARRV